MPGMRKVAALSLTLFACDPDQPEVEFRGLDPEVLYLSQYQAEITLDGFAELVQACSGAADPIPQPHVAVTWTLYPQGAGLPSVLGLGFSVAVPFEQSGISECYRKAMLALGATP